MYIFVGLIVGAIIWGGVLPYAKVESLTKKYGEEFADLYKQSSFIDEIEYFKVFYYGHYGSIAHIYYVESGHSTRNHFIFHKINREWKLISENCVWSSSGSANEYLWPFYP